MFRTKNRRIDIKSLYVNEHTLEQFRDRKTKQIDFTLPKEIQIAVMPQRSKNNKEVSMNVLRGVIPLKNKLFMVVNVYENRETKDIVMKALTVLTLKQLKFSKNFDKGNYLNRGYIIERPEIIEEEKFFNTLDDWNEYLEETIEWAETDVHYL